MRKREKGSKVEMQISRKRQKESEFFLVQKGGLKPPIFIYTVATVTTWTTAACPKTISVFKPKKVFFVFPKKSCDIVAKHPKPIFMFLLEVSVTSYQKTYLELHLQNLASLLMTLRQNKLECFHQDIFSGQSKVFFKPKKVFFVFPKKDCDIIAKHPKPIFMFLLEVSVKSYKKTYLEIHLQNIFSLLMTLHQNKPECFLPRHFWGQSLVLFKPKKAYCVTDKRLRHYCKTSQTHFYVSSGSQCHMLLENLYRIAFTKPCFFVNDTAPK